MDIFKSLSFTRFCYFCVAHIIRCFKFQFYMFMGYTISYIRNCFQNILKLTNIIWNFFNGENMGARERRTHSASFLLTLTSWLVTPNHCARPKKKQVAGDKRSTRLYKKKTSRLLPQKIKNIKENKSSSPTRSDVAHPRAAQLHRPLHPHLLLLAQPRRRDSFLVIKNIQKQ